MNSVTIQEYESDSLEERITWKKEYSFDPNGKITLSSSAHSVTAEYTSSYRIFATTYSTSFGTCNFGYEANPL